MDHTHIDVQGRFQSDKYPELPPDTIRLSFKDQRARRALAVLANDYESFDPQLSEDVRTRIGTCQVDPCQ